MVADKGKKLNGAVEDEEEIAEPTYAELVISIEMLQEVQDELDKVNEKASDEVLEIEQKYNEDRKPIFNKRNDVIKSFPDFWLNAFLSHPALFDHLTEEDRKVLKYMTSLEVEDSKDVKLGYSISFNFDVNPYFEDTKLTKNYTFLKDGSAEVKATTIKWKEGKDVSNWTTQDKKGNKRALEKKSFFTWFNVPPQTEMLTTDMYTADMEITNAIKEDLWTNPLVYMYDEDEFDGEEDEEQEKDSSEEDDEEQDESGN